MEVPRLGVESELSLPAYARATATPDLNHVCDLHHSSQQRQILNPLSEAGDPIRTVATGLHHSHSNAGSELHLQPTAQLTATPDP